MRYMQGSEEEDFFMCSDIDCILLFFSISLINNCSSSNTPGRNSEIPFQSLDK